MIALPSGQQIRDLGFKALNVLHRSVVRLSGGRLGTRAFGMELLELHVPGRTTGILRVTMLSTPMVQEDGSVILVASKGGDVRDPEWFLNLVAHPQVDLVLGGVRGTYLAHVLSGEEAECLWPEIVASYGPYGSYRRRAGREIPVVCCMPIEPS